MLSGAPLAKCFARVDGRAAEGIPLVSFVMRWAVSGMPSNGFRKPVQNGNRSNPGPLRSCDLLHVDANVSYILKGNLALQLELGFLEFG
jgi:hypothetical protein